MMKIALGSLFLLLLNACSGYFSDDVDKAGDPVQSLAIYGGGYLSSDTANDITPFLFRDAINGKNWIFFSSDRSGNYQIYYAEIFDNGTFGNPFPLDANLNTLSNEISPVVFRAYYQYNTTNYVYISAIRYLGNQTNLVTYQFSDYPISFNAMSSPIHSILNTNFTHLGISIRSSLNPVLEISYNQTNWIGIAWFSASMPEGWYGGTYTRRSGSTSLALSSVAVAIEFSFGTNYLCNTLISGKNQLVNAINYNAPSTNYTKVIPDYSSAFNDKDPFVDQDDNYKVYFSSDRYGKGNYDLYRYNTKTFDKVAP